MPRPSGLIGDQAQGLERVLDNVRLHGQVLSSPADDAAIEEETPKRALIFAAGRTSVDIRAPSQARGGTAPRGGAAFLFC